MAPGRRRGAKGVKTTSELSVGDLVLAKVKGFPAWPAKVKKQNPRCNAHQFFISMYFVI